MDKDTRNSIQRATQAARRLLEEVYREQLEGTYDILLDGTIAEQAGNHLSDRQKVTRTKLVAAVVHKQSTGLKVKEAVDAYLREAAFTTLNRFVALKMLEARQLVQECVSKGEDSSGFKEFTALAPGLVAVEDKGYRLYIETLFDEIGQEVKVLFDRRDVASLLWPDRQTLLELLGILNAPELASVWSEDETIGWVYQYFNGDEERTKMRAESQAPRNSRELAVRNQFFTPRYVVQFLTDNTLGRTWYEMMQSETQLAHLDYLVRRPTEVFLAEGEAAPKSETDDSELSQEELLQQTVHVPFRAKKDPRDLRILDPACGSGHFLLYTFDLLITIYEEAWADAEAAEFTATSTLLRADYSSTEELRRALPELILRHNLHGVDIDPRAAQIAALALWMRAQRAYNQFEVDRTQRPPITKTHIVVAEPMPGDAELVEEFAASLKPAVLGDLFKKMVEEMKLAGELGSLLKIEESMAKAVKEATEANQQGDLFGEKIESQDFWDTADEKIIAALGSFAESAAGSAGIRRQLFVGDAAQGVAFIELMRKRFDVVVMNPPFGDVSTGQKAYLRNNYLGQPNDLYACFIERSLLGLTLDFSAQLTSHTFLNYSSFSRLRKAVISENATWTVTADLGLGVMDAMVRASASIMSIRPGPASSKAIFIRLVSEESKQFRLLESCGELKDGSATRETYLVQSEDFSSVGEAAMAYWLPQRTIRRFRNEACFADIAGDARLGVQTSNNDQFLRLLWEVPGSYLAQDRWRPYLKGGSFSKYWSHIHMAIDWRADGSHILKSYGSSVRLREPWQYETAGLNYPLINELGFNASVMPVGCVYDNTSPSIYGKTSSDLNLLLGIVNSRFFEFCFRCLTSTRHWQVGYLRAVPWQSFDSKIASEIVDATKQLIRIGRELETLEETSSEFFPPLLQDNQGEGLAGVKRNLLGLEERRLELEVSFLEFDWMLDRLVNRVFGLETGETAALQEIVGFHVCEFQRTPVLFPDRSLSDLADANSVRWHHVSSFEIEQAAAEQKCHPRDLLDHDKVRFIYSHRVGRKLFSYWFGIAIGRWNGETVTVSMDEVLQSDPYLRPCNWKEHEQGEGESPVVLVDDPGHVSDVIAAIREVGTAAIPRSSSFISELLDDLVADGSQGKSGITRQWIKSGFFALHLREYSKSRRKAPIYWQLATPSASYSVWCYYHRLTRDTFFRVGNDYVTPKVDHEERKLKALRQEAGFDPSSEHRKAIDAQETFVDELRAFLTEVKRIAPLWNPNLNDGVIINFAPLWRLVPQNKAWQKECKKVWDKLVKGDYDWAHLAMHLWPERVVPKCQDDRSLAIAHGLEEEFWYEDDGKKVEWKKRKVTVDKVTELVAERSSSAVKAALDHLLEAPTQSGQARRQRRIRT